MQIKLSPELEKRMKAWSIEFNEPAENLAVGLLEEYFEDSDTGADISAAVKAGQMKVYDSVAHRCSTSGTLI